jgi:beta-phosphoglucomutase
MDDAARQLVSDWATEPGRAVIFDFNGTLSDDEPILLRLYAEMFREHLDWELTPPHYFAALAGLSDREIIERVVLAHGGGDVPLVERLLAERRVRYCRLVEEHSPVLPPTVELVSQLLADGVALAIVTGAQRIDVDFVLARSPLAGAFPVIVSEEDVTRGKPDPEGFLIAARALGVEASSILVFEDSVHGVQAAHMAGMACIAVEGTRTRAELAEWADAVVSHLGPGLLPA